MKTTPYSHRVRFRVDGGHVHATFQSSEHGPATTHGRNGTLVFRTGSDWNTFVALFKNSTGGDGVIVFIDETHTPTGEMPCGQPPDDVRGYSRRYCRKGFGHEVAPDDTAHDYK